MAEPDAEPKRKRHLAGTLILIALTLINDLLDWLNYTAGDPRYERDMYGRIVYTPLSQLYGDQSAKFHRRYFHRCTLNGCGCGFDGIWIFPGQCATLQAQVINGTYPGY